MESLAVDAAGNLMKMLGYKETDTGIYIKPSSDD